MTDLQPVRGTHDLLPAEMRAHRRVIDTAREIASTYGFDEMSTPIFEFTHVFKRTLGDTSDVVTKEMYTFTDKGGEEITLRPEATASIARAYLSNGLAQNAPVKAFYAGPMFRYERPQKGRLRQFHQIDVEILGAPQPQADIEIIACGQAVLDGLGLSGDITLELNTLGDSESRSSYRTALVEYFSDHRDALSRDSQDRLGRNPLRILDSKDSGDRELIDDAPNFADYLNQSSVDFFGTVREGLDSLGIGYRLNTRLVRGLDYYCHTAFEFTTTALGAQGTVMGGGRYDGLIGMMGGPETPGIGWAAGIERLAMLAADPPEATRSVAVVPLGPAAEARTLPLLDQLRRAGIRAETAFGGNMKKRMRHANKINAWAALILGDDELARGEAQIKLLDSGEQSAVALDKTIDRLAGLQEAAAGSQGR